MLIVEYVAMRFSQLMAGQQLAHAQNVLPETQDGAHAYSIHINLKYFGVARSEWTKNNSGSNASLVVMLLPSLFLMRSSNKQDKGAAGKIFHL